MKVLYYVPNITRENGGIRQYACALLKILAQDNRNEYFVLHNAHDPLIISILNEHSNLKLIPTTIGHERYPEKVLQLIMRLSNEVFAKTALAKHVRVISRIERLCNRYKIDVVYCPYQDIPHTTRKTVVTLHDVQEMHFPEFFSPEERVYRAMLHKNITEKSSLIIVSYEHIKQDLATYFQRTNNIIVCLLDMQNLWFDKFSPESIFSLVSYSLPEQFILYPAMTWSHKNHIGLINSIAYLRDECNLLINVVFTGHKTSYYDQIEEIVEQFELKKQIHFLGVVTDEVLFTLYHSARAVVIPTLYEAGSFPLMESILMRIPVVCSNVTSLPDTIGDDRFTFDPLNIVDMSDKIKSICFDVTYRQENLKNSDIRAPELRNTGALAKITKAMNEL